MKTRLKYFSKKDGWEQYWNILAESEDAYEDDLHCKAMLRADKLTSRRKVLWNSEKIRDFLFKREFNKYLKEN